MSCHAASYRPTKLPPIRGVRGQATQENYGSISCRIIDTEVVNRLSRSQNPDKLHLQDGRSSKLPPDHLVPPTYTRTNSLPGRHWDNVHIWPTYNTPLTSYRMSFGESANRRALKPNSEILCEFQSKLNRNDYVDPLTNHLPQPIEKGLTHHELTDMFSDTYMRNLPQMTFRRAQGDVAPYHAYMTAFDWGEPKLRSTMTPEDYCNTPRHTVLFTEQ